MSARRLFRGFAGLLALAVALAAETLTVATFNVENYNLADRMVEGVFRREYPKPEAEKAAVRRVIRAIAPDVLALQEMGAPPFLAELQRDLEREGWPMPHGVVLEAADPARHVAVLSRRPLQDIRHHAEVPVTLLGRPDVVKRGVLEVTIATDAGELTLFVVHLKSRRTERPDDPQGATQRLREAEAVRELVLRRFPNPARSWYVVAGDLNDTRMSPPVRALQARGKRELGQLLPAADSRGQVWTHYYRREDTYSRVDYLVPSPALRPLVEGGRGWVHDGDGSEEASDHRAVWARFRLKAGQ